MPMAEYVELIDKYLVTRDDNNCPSYRWVDNTGEIIRCKDCDCHYFADNRIPNEQEWMCALFGKHMKLDDYCSKAHKRRW